MKNVIIIIFKNSIRLAFDIVDAENTIAVLIQRNHINLSQIKVFNVLGETLDFTITPAYSAISFFSLFKKKKPTVCYINQTPRQDYKNSEILKQMLLRDLNLSQDNECGLEELISNFVIRFYTNELGENLISYKEWVDKEIILGNGLEDDIAYIIFVRNEIHQQLIVLKNQNIEMEKNTIKAVDAKWQNWAMGNTDDGYIQPYIPIPKPPKSLWWYWIDQIDKLTLEQRSTL